MKLLNFVCYVVRVTSHEEHHEIFMIIDTYIIWN